MRINIQMTSAVSQMRHSEKKTFVRREKTSFEFSFLPGPQTDVSAILLFLNTIFTFLMKSLFLQFSTSNGVKAFKAPSHIVSSIIGVSSLQSFNFSLEQ